MDSLRPVPSDLGVCNRQTFGHYVGSLLATAAAAKVPETVMLEQAYGQGREEAGSATTLAWLCTVERGLPSRDDRLVLSYPADLSHAGVSEHHIPCSKDPWAFQALQAALPPWGRDWTFLCSPGEWAPLMHSSRAGAGISRDQAWDLNSALAAG